MTINRRNFLRGTMAGIGVAAATSGLDRWVRRASASSLSRYAGHRSVVSLFLLGGNDGNQMLIPTGAVAYGHYKSVRPSLALASADLLKINPINTSTGFGLHPTLSNLKTAFTAGTASLVANVGPVALPTTRALLGLPTHPRPTQLGSHSDQQDAWASALPIPLQFPATVATTGWGGRLSDAVSARNRMVEGHVYPAATLLGGRGLFAQGASRALTTAANGSLGFTALKDAKLEALRSSTTSKLTTITNGRSLEVEVGATLDGAIALASARSTARAAAWAGLPNHAAIEELLAAYPADWDLPQQVLAVLQDIVAAATPTTAQGLGLKRQVFSIGLGGFDTHSNQLVIQDGLLLQVDAAIDVFLKGLALIKTGWPASYGLPPQSTLFTMSDFSRTLAENSNGGTDHGWGNHMIVAGAQVAGAMLHGRFPDLDLVNSVDAVDDEGRWIPSLSSDQYVYDLALWLGVSAGEAEQIFPNLAGYRAFATEHGMDAIYRQLRLPLMVAD
jgi:uncharacterized protein (DUF1501 family)